VDPAQFEGASPASFDLDQPNAYRCRIHEATITAISHGVGEGQIAVSGMLLQVSTIGSAKTLSGGHFQTEGLRPQPA